METGEWAGKWILAGFRGKIDIGRQDKKYEMREPPEG
jgi:hypothetical protein